MNVLHTRDGIDWRLKTRSNSILSWPPLLSDATTIGHQTVFDLLYCPDVISLGHEFWHVQNTNDLHYFLSWLGDKMTLGKLFKTPYWKSQEIAANAYGATHATDPDLVQLARLVRALYPASSPTATYDHPIT